MTVWHIEDTSLALTSPFMKLLGCWPSKTSFEELCRRIMRAFTTFVVLSSCVTHVLDAYVVKNPFNFIINIVNVGLACFKMSTLYLHKSEFFELINLLREKFLLISQYDIHEKQLILGCKRSCALIIIPYVILCHGTIANYIASPILVNMHLNETDRIHMYKTGFRTMSMTPYFEIMFVLQVVAFYQTCVCYFSVDSCLFIFNLHISCQFRILQHRLETLRSVNEKRSLSAMCSNGHYVAFKECIQQHQALISYSNMVTRSYSIFSLVQTLTYSLLICLTGYYAFAANVSFVKRCLFVFHILFTTCQLYMFCYGGDRLIRDSASIDTAVYAVPWANLPMDSEGRMLRGSINMVVMRARVPCSLSACGFFNISLETFTKIWSTALSYFALISETMAEA